MDKVEVLQKSRLFDNLLPEELEMVSELTLLRRYKSGETVFSEGDVGDSVYIIVEGEVDVLTRRDGSDKVLATLPAGAFFGEMSLIDKEYRAATVKARSECTLLQLSNENLHSFSKAYREGFTWLVVNIARVLSQRLRDMNKKLAERL